MINSRFLKRPAASFAAGLILFLWLSSFASVSAAEVYELRTYTTNEGRLDDLHARFRNHTIALFEKHGMKSVGYWVPTDGDQAKNTLIYVLRHESEESARKSWQAFIGDPDWQKVYAASTAEGRILAKAPEAVFMTATDYSPDLSEGGGGDSAGTDVVFELRTYTTNEGKLGDLGRRFSDHTIDLFKRHGMQSVAYWHPVQTDDTLIYILRHDSREAAGESWKGFMTDPEWQKVFAASRENGALMAGMPQAVYMTATDYSAIK